MVVILTNGEELAPLKHSESSPVVCEGVQERNLSEEVGGEGSTWGSRGPQCRASKWKQPHTSPMRKARASSSSLVAPVLPPALVEIQRKERRGIEADEADTFG